MPAQHHRAPRLALSAAAAAIAAPAPPQPAPQSAPPFPASPVPDTPIPLRDQGPQTGTPTHVLGCATESAAEIAEKDPVCDNWLVVAIANPAVVPLSKWFNDPPSLCHDCFVDVEEHPLLAGGCTEVLSIIHDMHGTYCPSPAPTPAPTPVPPPPGICSTGSGLITTLKDAARVSGNCRRLGTVLQGTPLSATDREDVCGRCMRFPDHEPRALVVKQKALVDNCPPLSEALFAACLDYPGFVEDTPEPPPDPTKSPTVSPSLGAKALVELGGAMTSIILGGLGGILCTAWFVIWCKYIRKNEADKKQDKMLKHFDMLSVHPTRFSVKREPHKPSRPQEGVTEEDIDSAFASALNVGSSAAGDGSSSAATGMWRQTDDGEERTSGRGDAREGTMRDSATVVSGDTGYQSGMIGDRRQMTSASGMTGAGGVSFGLPVAPDAGSNRRGSTDSLVSAALSAGQARRSPRGGMKKADDGPRSAGWTKVDKAVLGSIRGQRAFASVLKEKHARIDDTMGAGGASATMVSAQPTLGRSAPPPSALRHPAPHPPPIPERPAAAPPPVPERPRAGSAGTTPLEQPLLDRRT